MSKQNPPNRKPGGKGPRPPIDPLLLQRLEDLGQRRPAGAPLPPPAPGTAARAGNAGKASTTRSNAAATPKGPAKPNGSRPAPCSQEAKLAAAAERAAAARAAKAGGPGARPVPSSGRKSKPAASSKVAALAVSVASTAVLVGMFARQDGSTSDSVILTGGTAAAGATKNTTAATTATTVAVAGNAAPATTAPATTVAAGGTIKDGTYVGAVSQNRWGPVQVQVVYAGGQITDVQILQYPNDRGRSVEINQYALPILIQETVAAQSANINGVGGATYTSNSYYDSLQSALDTAKSQSGVTG